MRAILILGSLITVAIVGYLAKTQQETVPSVVTDVLPVEEGEAAPATLQDVPKHIQNKLNKKTDDYQKRLESLDN